MVGGRWSDEIVGGLGIVEGTDPHDVCRDGLVVVDESGSDHIVVDCFNTRIEK